ncbi:GNAT family N-acetyltransferase [Opitutaceae bacterium]|nr:GNAT family N-acetyltransferase [Opitutaceae bacterium]
MSFVLRQAVIADQPALQILIETSAKTLLRGDYTQDEIQAALGPVLGVDAQMIRDGTYFVVESDGRIVGCGGWSYREALYGGRPIAAGEPKRLSPEFDAARIRAFFVDPAFTRQGIGSLIMEHCEHALQKYGFLKVEISATLTGEPLYLKFGYTTTNYYQIELPDLPKLKVARMVKTYQE